jgi:hypothetical protein
MALLLLGLLPVVFPGRISQVVLSDNPLGTAGKFCGWNVCSGRPLFGILLGSQNCLQSR